MPRRERLAIFGFALCVAVGLMPQPAAAVAFLQVSYSVTGGTFNGPNLTGPITGGSVSYITKPGITSLPYGYQCQIANGCGQLTRVTLVGPTGSFMLINAITLDSVRNVPLGYGYGTALLFAAARTRSGTFKSGGNTSASLTGPLNVFAGASLYARAGAVRVAHRTGPFMQYTYHNAMIGPEVRTVVPEPATSTLLGLGLLGLAIGGGMRQLRRR